MRNMESMEKALLRASQRRALFQDWLPFARFLMKHRLCPEAVMLAFLRRRLMDGSLSVNEVRSVFSLSALADKL